MAAIRQSSFPPRNRVTQWKEPGQVLEEECPFSEGHQKKCSALLLPHLSKILQGDPLKQSKTFLPCGIWLLPALHLSSNHLPRCSLCSSCPAVWSAHETSPSHKLLLCLESSLQKPSIRGPALNTLYCVILGGAGTPPSGVKYSVKISVQELKSLYTHTHTHEPKGSSKEHERPCFSVDPGGTGWENRKFLPPVTSRA